MLDASSAPPLPNWTSSFVVSEGEYSDLRSAVYDFQKSLIFAYWEPTSMVDDNTPGLKNFKAELDALRTAKQYEAKKLISANVSSFDLQSQQEAVVTVVETWQDQIFNGEYPDIGGEVFSERGPYTFTVQYTLTYTGETSWQPWEVTQVVYSGLVPEWNKP
jgi:hypothetical protein